MILDGLLLGLAAGLNPQELAEELAVIAHRDGLLLDADAAAAEGAETGNERTLREILARASARPPES